MVNAELTNRLAYDQNTIVISETFMPLLNILEVLRDVHMMESHL
jgi:hypothetical protein